MESRQLQASEGNIARLITWLSILAMFAFFWIGVAALALRLLFRHG